MIFCYAICMKRLLFSLATSIRRAISNDPEWRRFVGTHPAPFAFLKNRLNPNTFFGRPFTLVIIAWSALLYLFCGVLLDVVRSNPIVAMDLRVDVLLATFRHPQTAAFFLWVTMLGQGVTVTAITIVACVLLYIWHKRPYIPGIILAVAGSGLTTYVVKILVHRARPSDIIPFFTESSFSFPSGHATSSAALYGFLLYLFVLTQRPKKEKWLMFLLSVFLIASIGFSRLYLGVHFFSDVWGGYLIGATWLVVGIGVTEWLKGKKWLVRAPTLFSPRFRKSLSVGLLLTLALFYVVLGMRYHPPAPHTPAVTLVSIGVAPTDIIPAFGTYTLPKYTEDIFGNPAEPVNLIIIARNGDELTTAFTEAGWEKADPVSIDSLLRALKALLTNGAYGGDPVTPAFWHAQVNDFGFEKSTGTNGIHSRHHLRLWKTSLQTLDGKSIYVGDSSYDIGIKWGITHKIAPDVDTERELVVSDLQQSPMVASHLKVHLVDPVLGKNFTGDQFFTDGNAYIITLK